MQMTNNKDHSYKIRFDFSILQMEIPDNQFHGYVVFFFKSYHPSNGNSW
jgi:hypothetical protein